MSSIFIMFVIQWVYALANIVVALLIFFYIGKTSPGLPIGDFFTHFYIKIRLMSKSFGPDFSLPAAHYKSILSDLII